jgi:hypothetical protein
MTVGIASAHANENLERWRGSAAPAISTPHMALAIGDPGISGTSNPSSVTTRRALTFATASGGSMSANGTLPSWTSWAGTNGEVVTHVTFWTASTSGTFLRSAALSTSVTMQTGYTLNITGITFSIAPIAA